MSGSLCWNRDEDDGKGDQRDVESAGGDDREDFAIAVEDEGKGIYDLVADYDMPGLDDTGMER